MSYYVIKRILYGLVTAFGLVLLVFGLMKLIPGSVVSQLVDQSAGFDQKKLVEIEAFLGLDRPWYVQFGTWFSDFIMGDMGNSWRSRIPVSQLLGPRLIVTLELAGLATLISVIFIGIPNGLLAANYKSKWQDTAVRVFSLAALSVPVFWMGSMLILIFSVYFKWSPPLTWVSPIEDPWVNISMMALPAFALGLAGAAPLVRMTRNSVLEVQGQNYIRTARSIGNSEIKILFNHALPNASIPIITTAGLQFGFLLGGVVVIEEVFALPGVGRLLLQAISQRDFPVVQACVLTIGIFLIFLNIIVDILYAYLDPRIRFVKE